MDKAMMEEVAYADVAEPLQQYVSLLLEMQEDVDAEILTGVYRTLIELSSPKQESKAAEVNEEGGSLLIEVQSDEDLESLRIFNSESIENIDNLDDKLPQLVKKPDDITMLNNLVRGYHTIKGAAGFLGLDSISQVTHEMENVLDRARQGKVRADDEMVSLMSRGNAWIKKHFQRLDALLEDNQAPIEVTLTIDNYAPIYYNCKAIMSRSEEDIEMVENSDESGDKDSSIRISSEYLDQFLDEIGGLINLAHIFNHSIAILEKSKMERS